MKKVIALDLGGTKISAAVVTSDRKMIKLVKEKTLLSEGWPGLRSQVLRICKQLISEHPGVIAVGIGSAGPLHAERGLLIDPTNFGWKVKKPIHFQQAIKKALHLPVVFDNDAVSAVLGEFWKGKCARNSIVVTLGTGVGVGILLNGHTYRGRDGYHPEAGHMVLAPEDKDIRCACGAPGCSEGVLSGVNFAKWVGRKTGRIGLSAQELTELAFSKDKEILKHFDDYALFMAQFLANLITIYYPTEIILSGSFAQAHPLYLDKTKKNLEKYFHRREKVMKILPRLKVSKLNNQDGLWGAANMAFQHKNYFQK